MAAAMARLAGLLAASALATGTTLPGARSVAVGWATVELDRAAAELALELGIAADAFAPAADDVALGARCRVAPAVVAVPGGRVAVVLLEPSTEGWLAARLARHGEGPAAVWLVPGDGASSATAIADLTAAGIEVGPTRDGPLGPAKLILDAPIWGPYRFLVVDRAGTIAS
jgi:hypothetical protein